MSEDVSLPLAPKRLCVLLYLTSPLSFLLTRSPFIVSVLVERRFGFSLDLALTHFNDVPLRVSTPRSYRSTRDKERDRERESIEKNGGGSRVRSNLFFELFSESWISLSLFLVLFFFFRLFFFPLSFVTDLFFFFMFSER